MKKIVMIVFTGLLISAGLQAQKVSIENGKVILDLTEGMPAGAITSDSKTVMFNNLIAQHGAPSSTSALWRSENQEGTTVQTKGEINKRIFEKLEVAPKDMNNAGVIGGTGTMTMNWVEAFNGCINSDYDSGGWRLPTQRELQMMWIFNDALTIALPKVSLSPSGTGIALSSANYRSATEYDASSAWNVTFGFGYTNSSLKPNTDRVRCVREVTTP
jgi:hypothetical protein